MSDEEGREEEETSAKSPKKKEPCYKVSDSMKPLVECCQNFEEGKLDSDDFFAEALIKTGEFMQTVKKSRESESGAEAEGEET